MRIEPYFYQGRLESCRSKSHAQRLLILSALSRKEVFIEQKVRATSGTDDGDYPLRSSRAQTQRHVVRAARLCERGKRRSRGVDDRRTGVALFEKVERVCRFNHSLDESVVIQSSFKASIHPLMRMLNGMRK